MPEIDTNAAGTAAAGSGLKADWSALSEDFSEVKVQPKQQEEVKSETKEEEKIEGVDIQDNKEEKKEEVKPELTPEEKQKAETEALAKEAKELGLNEGATKEEIESAKAAKAIDSLELKVDDIADVPKQFEEGTWGAAAKELFGIELSEESPEAFKQAFVPRAEFEKAQNLNLDTVLSTLKPETASAIKLIQMGIPEEAVFAPTAKIEEYLKMDDAALLRADLEEQGDLTPEIIDNKMEDLSADPQKMKLLADELRIYLNRTKKEIVDNRTQLIQKFEADRQNAILTQKEQERSQIKQAFDNVQEFMGVPVTKEIKDALVAKYNNGRYDEVLSNPQSKVELLFYKEFGQKFAKHIQNKASEAAKKEVREKSLNIPPKTGGGGNRVDTSKSTRSDNPFSAITEDFRG